MTTGDGAGSTETAPEAWQKFVRAVERWSRRADLEGLRGWFVRELDAEGIPRRLPVSYWWSCLECLVEAWAESGADWPVELNAPLGQLLGAALRFSRPDASAVFSQEPVPETRGALVRTLLKQAGAPGWDTVARWWFPRKIRGPRAAGAPPLPAYSSEDRPLAMLRADWNQAGDLVAIDQRDRSAGALIELFGLGRRWLGPRWYTAPDAGVARRTFWTTGPYADLAEWTFREGETRVTRSVLFLRGRHLAILGEQRDGPETVSTLQVELPEGIEGAATADSRAIQLKLGRNQTRVVPLGLPALPYPTDRGSFTAENGRLVLKQAKAGRRVWLPLVVSWDPERNRKPLKWRVLTVSEKSKACPPGVAFAARVSWGTDETLLIYRSLARPGLRAFLGHQTRDRIVVGNFDREGDVEPLLNVDENS